MGWPDSAEDELPGREQAVLDFLDGPSLRDTLEAARALGSLGDWLAPPESPAGQGADPSGWMLSRFGLKNP